MSRFIKICLSVLVLLGQFTLVGESSWTYEGHIWSSPYQDQKIYSTTLSYIFEPLEHWLGTLTLPIQYQAQKWEVLYPQVSLAWAPPLGDSYTGRLKLSYSPKSQQFQMEGGFNTLSDPIIINCAIFHQRQSTALNLGVVFAVNEKWALGAHLQYTKNSLLTYQLHGTSQKGKQRQLSYSHSLDGSLQRLGLKVTF